MWMPADPLFMAATTLIAAAVAFRAIISARTPQGAIGWAVIIAVLPLVGVPLYLIFGLADYSRTVAAQRAAETAPDRRAAAMLPCDRGERLDVFEALSGRRASRGNGADLLIDGEATYTAFRDAIAGARRYLLVQFYIIRNDEIRSAPEGGADRQGARGRERLRAARRVLRPCAAAMSGSWRRPASRSAHRADRVGCSAGFQLNFRSHRKVLIADGQVAFTGGFNIGDEYLGRHRRLGPWRDTHVRLTGPIIARLQQDFAVDWRRASGSRLPIELSWESGSDPRDMCGVVVAPTPTSRTETGNLYFCALAQDARRRLWIATPYFVPDTDVLSALKVAALRGVDVAHPAAGQAGPLPALARRLHLFRRASGCRRPDLALSWRASCTRRSLWWTTFSPRSARSISTSARGMLNFEHTALSRIAPSRARSRKCWSRDFAQAERDGERICISARAGCASPPIRRA